MIKVERGRVAAPATLDEPRRKDNKTELQRVREHRTGPDRDKAFEFTAYKAAAVKTALDQLFHGKCAYCESFYAKTQPVDVEHYRPKGEVDGLAGHPGYWWLAANWENLLPSCIDCNRKREQITPDAASPSLLRLLENGDFSRSRKISTGKSSSFPLDAGSPRATGEADALDAERRLLLDPTRDDPHAHLAFYIDRQNLIGLIYPRSVAAGVAPTLPRPIAELGQLARDAGAAGVSAPGAISIQVYGLNRLSLVQARTKTLRDLEFLLELSTGLTELIIEMNDRIEVKAQAMAGADEERRSELEEDRDFLVRAKSRLERFRDGAYAQLRSMTLPRAPFSALASAWMHTFVNEA